METHVNSKAWKEKTESLLDITKAVLEFMKPVLRFFIHYFLKLGVLNGYRGFQFSYILSYGVWKRFKLLKKLNNK